MFNIEENTVDREDAGVWADFKGSKFLIASSGSTKFQREFSRLQVPHRKRLDRGNLDPKIQLDIMARAMSSSLLLDWRDVVDSSGSDVSYNADMAYRALKGNSELREFIQEFATDLQNYVDEVKEDLGKDVRPSSNGTSSTADEKSS